jgi:hypothetical protein
LWTGSAVGVPQITLRAWQDVSSDERGEGWGERDWDSRPQAEGGEDPDEKRLREDRPPHHEERER